MLNLDELELSPRVVALLELIDEVFDDLEDELEYEDDDVYEDEDELFCDDCDEDDCVYDDEDEECSVEYFEDEDGVHITIRFADHID